MEGIVVLSFRSFLPLNCFLIILIFLFFFFLCEDVAHTPECNRDLTKLGRRRQGERGKSRRFNEKNNNSARASRLYVHFFADPAKLRREMTKFYVYLRTGTARR